MKTISIDRDVVVTIAKHLVTYDGDVNAVYEAMKGIVTKKVIQRVKDKRILPTVTDEIFHKGQFQTNGNTTSQDIVIGDIGNVSYSMTTDQTTTQTEKRKRRSPLPKERIKEVCESLIRHNGDVEKVFGDMKGDVSRSQIINIKGGHSGLSISKEYFTVKPWTPISKDDTREENNLTTTKLSVEVVTSDDVMKNIMSNTPRNIELLAAGKIKTTWPLPRILEMVNMQDGKTSIETLFALIDDHVGRLSLENIIKIIQE